MRYLCAALLGLSALPASAQTAEEFDVHAAVLEEAFDPDKLFQDSYLSSPILTVRYLGDDWDYPVYALALFKGCHIDDTERDETCRNRLQARMVRAPYEGEPERPRWRGSQLLSMLRDEGVSSRDDLLIALDNDAVEWMETDLANCATAAEYIRNSDTGSWFDRQPLLPEPTDGIRIIIHYDTVDVHYRPNYYTHLSYFGHIDEHLPSGWAHDFAKSLNECWKPSSAITPWRRMPPSEESEE